MLSNVSTKCAVRDSSNICTNILKYVELIWEGCCIDGKKSVFESDSNRHTILENGSDDILCTAIDRMDEEGNKVETKYPVADIAIEVDDRDMGELLREIFLQLSLHDNYILRLYEICWRRGVPFKSNVNHGQNTL